MKYYSVTYSLKGHTIVSAQSQLLAQEAAIKQMEANNLVRNSSLSVSAEFIPEMYKRCPRCNSKLLKFDPEAQKTHFLLYDNTLDLETPIQSVFYHEQHDIIKCSNYKCGYIP